MLLHDGAYGTLLAPHLRGDETADDLCTRDPRRVVDAHRAYVEAGADVVQTNAFLAHLRGSERRRRDLQLAALGCAREAVAAAASATDRPRPVQVLATLGPAGTEPRDFWRDIELLLDAEVDGVVCETVTTRAIADAFLAAWAEVARGVTGVDVLLGCSVPAAAGAAAWVRELAHDAPGEVQLGLNCCEGPTPQLRAVLADLADARDGHGAWAVPSAGLPTTTPDGTHSWPLADPEAWAEQVAALVDDLPVARVGGCCGTTPASLAALAAVLDR